MLLKLLALSTLLAVAHAQAQDDDDGMSLELGQRDSNEESDESEETMSNSPGPEARVSYVLEQGGFMNKSAAQKEVSGNWTQPKYIPTDWSEAKSKAVPPGAAAAANKSSPTTKRPSTTTRTKNAPLVVRERINMTTSKNLFAIDDQDDEDEQRAVPAHELLAKRITANEDIVMNGALKSSVASLLLVESLCVRLLVS